MRRQLYTLTYPYYCKIKASSQHLVDWVFSVMFYFVTCVTAAPVSFMAVPKWCARNWLSQQDLRGYLNNLQIETTNAIAKSLGTNPDNVMVLLGWTIGKSLRYTFVYCKCKISYTGNFGNKNIWHMQLHVIWTFVYYMRCTISCIHTFAGG